MVSASSIFSNYVSGYSSQGVLAQQTKQLLSAANQQQTNSNLSVQQQNEVQKLKKTDQAVHNHERAHLSAAGGIAVSGANYTYTTGPDGKSYATGGDVRIDASSVADDPRATLNKAETIRRAALAPADPSAQDYSVANQATQMEIKARLQLLQAQQQSQPSGSQLNVRA